jgi:hypothetical protein
LQNLFVQIKALVEAFYTTAGVNQLLSAGKEGVAAGADVNTDIFFGGTGFNGVPASTFDGGRFIFRMDSLFHSCHLFRVNHRQVSYHTPRENAIKIFIFSKIFFEVKDIV